MKTQIKLPSRRVELFEGVVVVAVDSVVEGGDTKLQIFTSQ